MTRIGQENRQSRKSVSGGMEAPDQGLDEAAKHCRHQHRRSRTVRWQQCSNRVDGRFRRLPKTWVESFRFRLHIDSSTALSITSRTGLGKAKHIEIQYLWLQEAVRNNKLMVEKIPVGNKLV